MSDMVEHIDGAMSPERQLIAQMRRHAPAFLHNPNLDDPKVGISLWYAHHIGKWAEFLALITDEQVTQILDLLENSQENVTALCDGLLDSIRRQHGERLARIVGGFLWQHGESHQFVSHATAAIMELAMTSMSSEDASAILTQLGWRAFVLS